MQTLVNSIHMIFVWLELKVWLCLISYHTHFSHANMKLHKNITCFVLFPPKLSFVEAFMIGAVAKMVATVVTYPLQTIQSILRVGFIHL